MSGPAVGIDLGTSNTVIAVVQGSKALVIPDGESRRIHPSVVSFHPNGSVLVGRDAKDRRSIDPANTVYSSKRLIGRRYGSEQVRLLQQRAAFAIVEGENQQPLISARGETFSLSEIAAFVLRYARALAERYIGEQVENTVITVPANFDDAQREATRVAGQIAGLNVLRVLNEPTAAALAYGYGRGMSRRVAVYDFGGGTFDITLLQLDGQVFEVLSTAGDTFLGGDDIDEYIVGHMVDTFLRENRLDLREDASAMGRLRGVAEQLKCHLSSHARAAAKIEEIGHGDGGRPLTLNVTITAEQLNQMTDSIVRRSLQICDEALRLAGLSVTQIDDVVMVGGTTRMPIVRQAVQHYFGIEPRVDINPDEVVAVGAAIQAMVLSRDRGGDEKAEAQAATADSVLLDVIPRALGIAVVGGYAENILKRNAPIPVEQTRRFTTSRDEQRTVRIQVCQGESRMFEENQAMGELVLDDLRLAPRGQVKIEVTFEVDTDGILKVSAVDLGTGKMQNAHIRLLGMVSEDKVEEMARRQQEMPVAV